MIIYYNIGPFFRSQTPKKPPSSKPKEEGGLKVSKTTKSRPAGSTSSNISPAPPQGELSHTNVT